MVVLRSPLFKIESAVIITELTQFFRAGDLCPIGLNVLSGSTPRIKFVNYCGAGTQAILHDIEIGQGQAATAFQNNYIENMMDRTTVSQFLIFKLANTIEYYF